MKPKDLPGGVRVGDMVRADHLGPAMRIVRIEGAKARCAWRDETGHQLADFDVAGLVLVDDQTVTKPLPRPS